MNHDDESAPVSFYITLRDSEQPSYETPQCAHADVTVLELRHLPAALRCYRARAGGSTDRMKLQLPQTINEGPAAAPQTSLEGRITPPQNNHPLASMMIRALWENKDLERLSTKSS